MPQLDFSLWLLNLLINWTLLATLFLTVASWNNKTSLKNN